MAPEPAISLIALLGTALALGLLAVVRVVRGSRGRLVAAAALLVAWLTGLVWRVLPFDAHDV